MAAGSHTITFVGVDPTGADYTALLDQVSIVNAPPTGFTDPGFEGPSQGTGRRPTSMIRRARRGPSSAPAGVAGNGSGLTSSNPNAPQGSQVAFLQWSSSISQVVSFPAAGSYLVSFSAAQRANTGTSDEEVQVEVDGTVVGTFTPASTSYANYATAAFNVAAGSHTITFVGVDPTGAYYTALLDQVDVNSAPPTGVTDPGFESPSQGTGASAPV